MQTSKRTKPPSFFRLSKLLTHQTQLILDLLTLICAFVMAYLLRFDFSVPDKEFRHMVVQLPYTVVIQLAVLMLLRVQLLIWRYTGMAELKIFVKAAFLSAIPLLIIRLGLGMEYWVWQVPLSIICMDTFIGFSAVLGLRVLRRVVYEWSEKKKTAIPGAAKKAVLLIGAGRAGVLTAKEIQNSDIGMEIKGFIDDDIGKVGSRIQGIKVLGTTADLPRLVADHKIDHVIISMVKATRSNFRRVLDICEGIPIKVRVIPALPEIIRGNVKVSRIRHVQIEDLLGREQVQLDEEAMEQFLTGKIIMVTGAGGSIGSELARQVARFNPACLLLVERAEFALFDIDREIGNRWPELKRIPLIADISDRARMRSIFSQYHPQVVVHAAAHKHVPMMEINATEAVKNNILATHLLGDLAGRFGAEVFVLISTDKAVRPTSVMGASKRMAELVVQSLDRNHSTRYLAVRFGNVIGSAGSVIPIFREQIRNGGPVTVTHPEMMRYFMTIPEAAQLVLQAGSMGKGGEIFVLNMGEPVRILDLAKEAIALSGLRPFEDIEIVFTGMRPGEKLFEELEMTDELLSRTQHPKIFIGKMAVYPDKKVRQALERLESLSSEGNEPELRRVLNAALPEARLAEGEAMDMAAVATHIQVSQGATAFQ